MRQRHLLSIGVLMLAVFIVTLMSVPATGQTPTPKAAASPTKASPAAKTAPAANTWTPPKTPWGDPDLQGIYTSDDYIGVGLQRQAQYGDRLYLSEEEIRQRESQIANQAKNDLVETVSSNARVGTGPPGHWGERAKRPPKQTSLIVDPPDGRVPQLTPEARSRVIPLGAGVENPQPASWEDFSYYIRCITRGVTGSIYPVIYGNGTQIIQGPGYVAIFHEMVHEARIIPLDGRPHV